MNTRMRPGNQIVAVRVAIAAGFRGYQTGTCGFPSQRKRRIWL